MSEEKLSSEEVPGKFTEWLLAMGCPADIVPSHDKMTEMCRGQYHLVWRSLMERVGDRSVIREKRMQVFCDDVRRCQKKNVFSHHDSSTIVPEQLSLWKQQSDVRKAVQDAKARVTHAQRDLDQLMDKVSNKMSERVLARERLQNASRRAWLLRQVAADLTAKKSDLHEAKTEANSLCPFKDEDEADMQEQIDKCLSAYSRQLSLSPSDSEEAAGLARGVARGGGGAGLRVLLERRAALVQELNKQTGNEQHKGHGPRPAGVLARSAALHCTLMLEAAKNKLHLQHARSKLLLAVNELKANYHLSTESCELLVLRCEQSHAAARARALRALLDDVTGNGGAFHTDRGHVPPLQAKPTQAVDKAIENKKEDLKRLISLLHSTERKLQSARDCLQLVLAAYSGDGQTHYRESQLDLPSESIPLLREWYTQRRARRRRRVDLSMELEASDQSLGDVIDVNNLTFADELRIYLKKFSLEKNRQLVLESGEKVWVCETLRAARRRLLASYLADENKHTSVLCPAITITHSVRELVEAARLLGELRGAAQRERPSLPAIDIDITLKSEEEQQIIDKTKKRLRESVLELQKTNKIFVAAEEDLKFWSNNAIKKYISPARKYDGMAYRDYEMYYIENCLHV